MRCIYSNLLFYPRELFIIFDQNKGNISIYNRMIAACITLFLNYSIKYEWLQSRPSPSDRPRPSRALANTSILVMVAFSSPDHFKALDPPWLIRPPWPSLLTVLRTIMSDRKLWVFHLLLFLLDLW